MLAAGHDNSTTAQQCCRVKPCDGFSPESADDILGHKALHELVNDGLAPVTKQWQTLGMLWPRLAGRRDFTSPVSTTIPTANLLVASCSASYACQRPNADSLLPFGETAVCRAQVFTRRNDGCASAFVYSRRAPSGPPELDAGHLMSLLCHNEWCNAKMTLQLTVLPLTVKSFCSPPVDKSRGQSPTRQCLLQAEATTTTLNLLTPAQERHTSFLHGVGLLSPLVHLPGFFFASMRATERGYRCIVLCNQYRAVVAGPRCNVHQRCTSIWTLFEKMLTC